MASKAVEQAVEAHLTANWTHAAVCPIYTENVLGETPGDGQPFLILQFPLANVDRLAVTDRYYREEGGFRIVIHVMRGQGTEQIRDYGAELAAMFRETDFGGVETGVPSEPFTDDRSDEGLFYSGAMVVPYTFHFYG